jgi:integrase
MGGTGGAELRETSIRILFSHQGKQRKETLYLDNAPLAPTPANAKYARRVATEIRRKIKAGTFNYAEYFPHSPRALAPAATNAPMLFDVMDKWHRLLELKASTKRQYGTRLNSFWKVHLKNVPITEVKYSDILEALQKGTWSSGKSRNNELSMIKQMFEFARKDKMISENPCAEIERSTYQRPAPDPLSIEEAHTIIASIREHYGAQLWNFTQFVFFTGLRTSEVIGLRWENADFVKKEVKVDGANVYDEETDTTKAGVERTVRLNSLAMEALHRQKAHTFLAFGHIFHDPKTGGPWAYSKITDVRGHWLTTLKRCGIRYRRPYNMRHTYATVGLMAGANPAFLAKQLGHSLEMFFNVYADWINGNDNDREMAKIEASLSRFSPELTPEAAA